MTAGALRWHTTIAIGETAVGLETDDESFLRMVEDRYSGFVDRAAAPAFQLTADLSAPDAAFAGEDVRVFREGDKWKLERGDFRAEWEPSLRRGRVRQSANPYSLDTVLRIVHTLVLAEQGGFLVHASSAIRNGRSYLFAGVSGAGKTTIVRLAPADANVLTDEISYVTRQSEGYAAFGTPFAGELGKPGENLKAPLAAIYLLAQGPCNRIDEVPAAAAVRGVLANVLFFARDAALVQAVFRSAAELVERVPVRRLTFVPDARVWDLLT